MGREMLVVAFRIALCTALLMVIGPKKFLRNYTAVEGTIFFKDCLDNDKDMAGILPETEHAFVRHYAWFDQTFPRIRGKLPRTFPTNPRAPPA